MSDITPPAPRGGGSYVYDPVTGEISLVQPVAAKIPAPNDGAVLAKATIKEPSK